VCAAFAVLLLALVSFARTAHAEAPSPRATPVHVLSIDSDDAEDQADALSGAIRSRVRLAPGWSLQETSHSLSMLTAALRCPQKPDTPCLQRIGDQIHTDRFIWGTMSKGPNGQVIADLHLWSRGKPDTSVRETYSENLKDQNDETLRKIAAHILDRLTGTSSNGTLTVHAGEGAGQVLVNGQRKATLEKGAATMELPAGSYAVEVRAPGFVAAKQQVTVTGGTDTPLALKLVPEKEQPEVAADTGKPTNVRKIVGWSAVGLGAAFAVVGVIEGVRFLGIKDDLNSDRAHVDKSVSDVCAPEQAGNPFAASACNHFHDARTARTLGLLFGGIGAALAVTGVVLLVTDHPTESAPAESALKVTPYASPLGGGVDVQLAF